jgi:hypothetical protein
MLDVGVGLGKISGITGSNLYALLFCLKVFSNTLEVLIPSPKGIKRDPSNILPDFLLKSKPIHIIICEY